MKSKSNLFLKTIILFALTLSSCTSNKSVIATAVAMTVQAQNTQLASVSVTDMPLALVTNLPLATIPTANTLAVSTPASLPALTSLATAQPATTSGTKCYANATYVTDSPPDGTVITPGALFTHTWQIQNTGTCPWDSTWKFAYVSGDLMGAAVSYPLTYTAANQTMNLSVVFTAPTTLGSYRGYWEIVSQWGAPIRDSGSGNPWWVDINVKSGTSGTPTVYSITSITYAVTSITGCCTCGANMRYTTTATISSSGPLKIYYYWAQSDGGRGSLQTLNFTEASSITVQDTWPLLLGHEIGIHWEYIVVTSPVKQTFPNTDARYDHECI